MVDHLRAGDLRPARRVVADEPGVDVADDLAISRRRRGRASGRSVDRARRRRRPELRGAAVGDDGVDLAADVGSSRTSSASALGRDVTKALRQPPAAGGERAGRRPTKNSMPATARRTAESRGARSCAPCESMRRCVAAAFARRSSAGMLWRGVRALPGAGGGRSSRGGSPAGACRTCAATGTRGYEGFELGATIGDRDVRGDASSRSRSSGDRDVCPTSRWCRSSWPCTASCARSLVYPFTYTLWQAIDLAMRPPAGDVADASAARVETSEDA